MPNKLRYNWGGVEPATGRRQDHVEPGTYRLRITDTGKEGAKSSTGKLMPTISFEVVGGKESGKRLMDFFVMESDDEDSAPPGAGKLLALMLSAKVKVPRKTATIDLEGLQDRICLAEVYDDEYKGRPQSRIGAYLLNEPKKSKRKAADDDEDEDEDEEDEDEDEEDEEEEEEAPPARRKAKAAPKASTKSKASASKSKAAAGKRRRPADDDDEDDDEDEDDEDEDFDF